MLTHADVRSQTRAELSRYDMTGDGCLSERELEMCVKERVV